MYFPKKISAPPSGKTVRRVQRGFGGAEMVQTTYIIVPSLVGWTLHATEGRKCSRFVFLYHCLSVMLLSGRVCECDVDIKPLELINDLPFPPFHPFLPLSFCPFYSLTCHHLPSPVPSPISLSPCSPKNLGYVAILVDCGDLRSLLAVSSESVYMLAGLFVKA